MPPRRSRTRRSGVLALAAAATMIGVIWLVLLPRIGAIPAVRGRIEANEALGINPGAMYYTELEAMPAIRERVDRRREADEGAFWKTSQGPDSERRVLE